MELAIESYQAADRVRRHTSSEGVPRSRSEGEAIYKVRLGFIFNFV